MQVDEREPDADASPTGVAAPPVAARVDPPTTARIYRWWSPLWLYLIVDLAALMAVALVGPRSAFTAVAPLATIGGLRVANLYRRTLLPSALKQVGAITTAVAAGALVAAALTSAPSRTAALYLTVAGPLVLVARAFAYGQQRRMAMRRPEPAIVVGTGSEGQELVSRLLDHPEYGITPVGFVDSAPSPIDPDLPLTVIGGLPSLLALVERFDVERIFLDSNSVSEGELLEVLNLAGDLDVEISVLPALARHLSTSIAVEGIAGATVLSYRPSRHQGISWAAKRIVDIVGALAMLVVSAPLWLGVAIAIKLDSRGPVLYKQTRVGRHGRLFTIYKFRSMQVDADANRTLILDLNEANGPYFKVRCDPRITRVGRYTRRFSIDELPQVLNVLRGDMSLVGPRPALASEVAEYPDWFRRRLAVRPGLSGLWQVSGRFLLPFSEATRLDVSYVDHWSLGLDLQILARTPAVVISGRGAG